MSLPDVYSHVLIELFERSMNASPSSRFEILMEAFVGYEKGKGLVRVSVGSSIESISELWVLVHVIM